MTGIYFRSANNFHGQKSISFFLLFYFSPALWRSYLYVL